MRSTIGLVPTWQLPWWCYIENERTIWERNDLIETPTFRGIYWEVKRPKFCRNFLIERPPWWLQLVLNLSRMGQQCLSAHTVKQWLCELESSTRSRLGLPYSTAYPTTTSQHAGPPIHWDKNKVIDPEAIKVKVFWPCLIKDNYRL